MISTLKTHLSDWLKRHLPLLIVIVTALIIAWQNIDPARHYAGWDNILAEFDVVGYARQVLFGSWSEHQGLGAPSAQAQLAEIPRLPILFFLQALLPANLIRYAFIFLMYLIGGIGMYAYLSNIWFKQHTGIFKNWLAGLGAELYLLHVLTLQQFYISFEMFTVQFAFLPFVLLNIHALLKKPTIKNILMFIGLQFLIAPSGHTPTVFYLAAIFTVIYAFFAAFKKNIFKATKAALLIGLLTFVSNAYWIVPNLYYSFSHAEYVEQSRENRLFAPESVWSVREAGTISNLTSGTHYLFNWQDYSFDNHQYQPIFNEWQQHLSQPLVAVALQAIGVMTLVGVLIAAVDTKKGHQRWAVIAMFGLCLSFIWIDLFPTSGVFDRLYQSGSFLEAFRNPFTKLSILYSFLSVILFVETLEWLLQHSKQQVLKIAVLVMTAVTIVLTAWPSFQGNFISENLQISFPPQYEQLFSWLRNRDEHQRLLELPQLSHVAWEYYDWPFIEPGNGYQGMGFYFFGFSQPFLNRDSDRWVETSDFFYHELKPALDNQDASRTAEIAEKYNVDVLVVDETKIDPNRQRDYTIDHYLAEAAGFTKVKQWDFLTAYERHDADTVGGLIVPETIHFIGADTDRARTDVAFQQHGNYIMTDTEHAAVWYPFSQLVAHETDLVRFAENRAEILRALPSGNVTVTLPGLKNGEYFSPAAITYENGEVRVIFPELTLELGDQRVVAPKLDDFEFQVSSQPESVIVFFHDLGVIVEENATAYPVLRLSVNQPVRVEYAPTPEEIPYLDSGEVDGSQLQSIRALSLPVDWAAFEESMVLEAAEANTLRIQSRFPVISLDLTAGESLNCSTTDRGEIQTAVFDSSIIYTADQFAVNCSGYGFEYISPAYSYVMRVKGNNYQGRATKFFVSYSDANIVPEDYVFQRPTFDTFITIDQVSTDPRSQLYLNWETRSFGKEGINELESIEITPLPLAWLAQLRVEKAGDLPVNAENAVRIHSQRQWFDSLYRVNAECQGQHCYFGIDQSHDDLWLAFNLDQGRFLPHFRYNNWANLWQLESDGTVIVFYVPTFVAWGALFGLTGGVKPLAAWFAKRFR